MENKNYNKLALEIFGEKAFADPDNPIADMEQFAKSVNEVLRTIDDEQRELVIAVCLEGKDCNEHQRQVYEKGIRALKHPSRSGKLRSFIK